MYFVFRLVYNTSVPGSRHVAWFPLGNLVIDVILAACDPDVPDGAGELAGDRVRGRPEAGRDRGTERGVASLSRRMKRETDA